ncbi:agmatine deiminase family protein, partial [Flavobacterium sp.]|uniref:agmatine deiminase family protein n=1 Tax=Flavobacterium sp. TaxID=239 RepID=UPI00391CA470
MKTNLATPQALGYYFPAEFAPQEALWLSWPHKEESWPGKIHTIFDPYAEFILQVASHQRVCINVADAAMQAFAEQKIKTSAYAQTISDFANRWTRISFYHHPTNDAWCRDHGPAFLLHKSEAKKAIVDWGYNAWGCKYPPFDLDDVIPTKIGEKLGLPVFNPGIV